MRGTIAVKRERERGERERGRDGPLKERKRVWKTEK